VLTLIFDDLSLSSLKKINATAWVSAFYVGVVSTAIGFGIWFSLLKKYSVNKVSPFMLFVPFFGILFSILFFDSKLTNEIIIGWAIDLSLRPYILKMIIDKLPNLKSDTIVGELSGLVIFYVTLSLLVVIMFRFSDFIWLKLNPPLKRHAGDLLMKKMMEHSLT